ncbi:MAG: Pyrolysin precursor [Methanosaeta sp. PtaB.Bin039]|nr:MAG: Pyrolysin precursor [Methanosaeta sp. PtaB.Bin039]
MRHTAYVLLVAAILLWFAADLPTGAGEAQIYDKASRWFDREVRSFLTIPQSDDLPPTITNARVFPGQLKRGDPVAEITAYVSDPAGISSVHAQVGRKVVLMMDPDGDGKYTGYCGSNIAPGHHNVTIVAVDKTGNIATSSCQMGLNMLDPSDLNGNHIDDSLERLGQVEARVIVLHDRNLTASQAQDQRALGLLPGSAMTLRGDQIAALSKMEGVKGIYKDQRLRVLAAPAKTDSTRGVPDPRRSGLDLTGQGVTVALVDTGADPNHSSLQSGDANGGTKIVAFQDFVNGLSHPYDDNGHGTHCASLIAGSAGLGVAPDAKLVVVKVMDRDGACYLSDGLTALDWCLKNRDLYGIDVISFSVGGESPEEENSLLDEACNRMTQAGIVMVVAAGNSGPAPMSLVTPGGAEQAITVGAVYGDGSLFSRSSRGPTADGRLKPDLVTLGVGVVSAVAGTRDGQGPMSGTSMAVPQVSGAAALLLEGFPDLTPSDVKRILAKTAVDLGEPGPDYSYGWGALNLQRAVQALREGEDEVVAGPEITKVVLSRDQGRIGEPVVIEAGIFGEIAEANTRISGPAKVSDIPMVDFDSNGVFTAFWDTNFWDPGDYTLSVEIKGRYGEKRSTSVPFRLSFAS